MCFETTKEDQHILEQFSRRVVLANSVYKRHHADKDFTEAQKLEIAKCLHYLSEEAKKVWTKIQESEEDEEMLKVGSTTKAATNIYNVALPNLLALDYSDLSSDPLPCCGCLPTRCPATAHLNISAECFKAFSEVDLDFYHASEWFTNATIGWVCSEIDADIMHLIDNCSRDAAGVLLDLSGWRNMTGYQIGLLITSAITDMVSFINLSSAQPTSDCPEHYSVFIDKTFANAFLAADGFQASGNDLSYASGYLGEISGYRVYTTNLLQTGFLVCRTRQVLDDQEISTSRVCCLQPSLSLDKIQYSFDVLDPKLFARGRIIANSRSVDGWVTTRKDPEEDC